MEAQNLFENVFTFLNQGWVGSTIGILGIIIGCIIGIFFYKKGKRKPCLSYGFYEDTLLYADTSALPNKVKIFYDGKEVSNIEKANVILWNNGNKTLYGHAVVSSSPILITFGDRSTNFFRYQVIKKTRDENNVKIMRHDTERNSLKIDFDYLDPGDGVNIEILHNSESFPEVTGTIREMPKGITLVKNLNTKEKKELLIVKLLPLLFSFISIPLGVLDFFNIYKIPEGPTFTSGELLLYYGLFMLIMSVYMFFVLRRKAPPKLT